MRLLRYNFRVLMFRNWWLLVFPIAASQLVVFWNLITLRFEESLPAYSMEMVSPLLAAFLCAHVLSAEYRSGVGAILASKPVDIGKVVAIRMLVVQALVWALALLSLVAFYYGWQPYPIWPAFVACLPSTIFLGLMALAFATLFRNAWAGFGVASLWWVMDLPPGPLINPFLSLRSYSASLVSENMHRLLIFTRYAWEPKVVLLILAVGLYLWHRRLIFTLGSPHTAALHRRAVILAVLIPIVYAGSGAALKVGYLYFHRGRLLPDDTAWIRTQFAPFGPVPVAWAFGPVFAAYVGEIPNTWRLQSGDEADVYGNTEKHRRQVAAIVRRGTRSIWGSNVVELYTRLAGQQAGTPEERIALLRLIVERYPKGPHAAQAYVRIAREYTDMGKMEEAREACERALDAPHTAREAADALRMLTNIHRQAGRTEEAIATARQWFDVADARQRFKAGEALFDMLNKSGRTAEARDVAAATLDAIRWFREELARADPGRKAGTDTPLVRDADVLEGRLKAFLASR
jgi:ABC-type transport system involved in multi-copper enzyme maturation permease subunit